MSSAKHIPPYKALFPGEESPQQDKKKVEALIKDLNFKIQKDSNLARKAADILSAWMEQQKKPKP